MKKHFVRRLLFMMLISFSITSFSFANTYDEVKKGNGTKAEFVAISCDVGTTDFDFVNLSNGTKAEFVAISCDVGTTDFDFVNRYLESRIEKRIKKNKLKQFFLIFRKARDGISL